LEYHAKQGRYIKALEERPLVEVDHVWIWTAFTRLSTSRQSAGFGQGSISFLSTVTYCREMGLGIEQREFLWEVVQKLDKIFLKHVAAKTKPKKKP